MSKIVIKEKIKKSKKDKSPKTPVTLCPEKQVLFIEALREQPNIARACRKLYCSRTHAIDVKNREPEFSRLWDMALVEGTERLEEAAWDRASREDKPSDLLAIFLLKAHKPKKYRERYDVTSDDKKIKETSNNITIIEVSMPTDE